MRDEMMQTEKGSRNKKFVRDLGIYAIGNLGSKLITFLLVPFYTFFITDPAEFGYYDVCLTVVFCFGPFVTLQLSEGGFRFLLDSKDTKERSEIVSYVLTTMLRNAGIVVAIGLGVALLGDVRYISFIIIFGLLQTTYDASLQLVRGLGETKIFMYAGILNSLSIAMLSVLFIAVLPLGVPGLFLANIGARLITLGFVENRVHLIGRYFRPSLRDKKTGRELLKYSLPLLPAALCWWFINANNQFVIINTIGLDQNGYYGFVCKFTGILFILAYIFFQAWQQNAIEQYHSPDRDRFFSNVFNNYMYALCALVVLFSFGLRLNYFWIIAPEFQLTSQYIYLNAIFVFINALSQFFELGYQCSKNTARILPSLIMIAALNIGLNFLFVRWFALYGIIYANIITFSSLFAYRWIDTNKYMHIRVYRSNIVPLALLAAGGAIYQTLSGTVTDIICVIVFGGLFVYFAPKELTAFVTKKFQLSKTR